MGRLVGIPGRRKGLSLLNRVAKTLPPPVHLRRKFSVLFQPAQIPYNQGRSRENLRTAGETVSASNSLSRADFLRDRLQRKKGRAGLADRLDGNPLRFNSGSAKQGKQGLRSHALNSGGVAKEILPELLSAV
jgi:hypothetical protein